MSKQVKGQSKRRWLIWATVALCLLVAGALELTSTTHVLHKKPTPKVDVTTASQNTKGEPPNSTTLDASKGDSIEPGDSKSATGGSSSSSNTSLLAPSGNFISNHNPNLSGSPAPSTMQSVCNTTPGAQCLIRFTKGTTVKQLIAQTTDRGGSTYWDWKIQDIGLTEGTWQVEAVASLGTQTESTRDALSLKVEP